MKYPISDNLMFSQLCYYYKKDKKINAVYRNFSGFLTTFLIKDLYILELPNSEETVEKLNEVLLKQMHCYVLENKTNLIIFTDNLIQSLVYLVLASLFLIKSAPVFCVVTAMTALIRLALVCFYVLRGINIKKYKLFCENIELLNETIDINKVDKVSYKKLTKLIKYKKLS